MTGRFTPDPQDQRFARRVAMVAIVVAIVALAYKAAHMLLLGFGAGLGAILLSAVADAIDRRTPLSRGLGVAVASLLLLTVIGLIGWLFGTETASQIGELHRRLPEDWARVQAWLSGGPEGKLLLDAFQSIGRSSRAATVAAGFGIGVGEILLNLIVLIIGAIFLAAQPQVYRRGLLHLVPLGWRPVADDALGDVAHALRLWLLTQLISMTMMGIMIGLGLMWSGLPAAAALGLLGGLSEFIPYVGPTVAMIPALVIALAGSGSVWGVLVTYGVVRLIQANLITPLISQRVVKVPPGLYLLLILSCGAAFGTYGLFFSGALSVAIFTLTIRLWVRETLGDDGVKVPGES